MFAQNLVQTRISMPLSDTFSEPIYIQLSKCKRKIICLSPHFFVKLRSKVRGNLLCLKTSI